MDAAEFTKLTLKKSGDKKSHALQSDDEESRFSSESSDENELLNFGVTAKTE